MRGSTRDVMANLLDLDILLSEFELQSRYSVQIETNTLGEGIDVTPPVTG